MLQLSRSDYEKIVAHGLSGKPLEICGLLVGKKNGEEVVVHDVHEVDSLDKSELTYSMDGLKYMKVEADAAKRGLQIVGIYHTHPATVPYPSKTDVARAHWEDSDDLIFPGYSYLIVSLRDPQNPEPRSFYITGKRLPEDIVEETVAIGN
jgi:[CysO sulfur-carrier protein]-S-L-cysteine hydrolase